MTEKQHQQIAEIAEKFSGDTIFFNDSVLYILESLATTIAFSLRFGKTRIKLYTQDTEMLFVEILFRKSWGDCFSICFCTEDVLLDQRLLDAHLPPKAAKYMKAYRVNVYNRGDIDKQLLNWLINSHNIRA